MLDAAELIRAGERLESIMDGAASAGNLKKGASRNHIRTLTKRIDREQQRQARRRPVPATALQELTSFGIRIEPASKAGAA